MVRAPAVSADQRDPHTEPDPSRARSVVPDVELGTRRSDELPRLTRLALRLVRDPARVEDLVQEAALRAWAKQDQLRQGAPIGPWLNRILVNFTIDGSRVRRDEVDLADVEERWRDDDYTVDPEQVMARAEQREDLEDALARLPVGYRTVVVLHDAADMTTPTIADALDIG